jgi:uncharacterized protein YbaP (TraB family)
MRQGLANRWLRLLLVGILLASGWQPLAAASGVLFECQLAGRPPSYLLGTMHTGDPRVMAVADAVHEPLRKARRLVLEMVPDGPAMLAATLAALLPRGQTLDELLEADLYEAVLAAMSERGVLPEVTRRMQPWAVAVELSLPPGDRGLFLDLHLYQLAEEQGLEVVGLESVDEQLAVFGGLPLAQQVALLRQAIKNLPGLPQQYQAMVNAYLTGDLQGLQRLAEVQQHALDDDLAHWFDHAVVHERNRRMAERLRPWLEEGGAVVAVGALHLVGDTGLLRAARRTGCRLRALR